VVEVLRERYPVFLMDRLFTKEITALVLAKSHGLVVDAFGNVMKQSG
jgi:hypothetical protein